MYELSNYEKLEELGLECPPFPVFLAKKPIFCYPRDLLFVYKILEMMGSPLCVKRENFILSTAFSLANRCGVPLYSAMEDLAKRLYPNDPQKFILATMGKDRKSFENSFGRVSMRYTILKNKLKWRPL